MGEHTKKVTAFVGSAHKGGATYTAAYQFLKDLESFGDVCGEIVVLSDYNLGVCRGCKTCFARGEECCPLTDDRDVFIEKMLASDNALDKLKTTLAKQSRRFHAQLLRPAHPAPSLFGLMAFRMGRTSIRRMLDENSREYVYYRDHGWFGSDYYYSTHLGPFKKAAGAVFDWAAARNSP